MGGAAGCLKPNPDSAERFFEAPGEIALPSKYLNFAGWDQLDEAQDVLSFILIGTAESIRNLGGLIQYGHRLFYTDAQRPFLCVYDHLCFWSIRKTPSGHRLHRPGQSNRQRLVPFRR